MFSIRKIAILLGLSLLPALCSAEPRGGKLLAEGKIDQATSLLQMQVREAPNDAESYHLLCRAYFSLGNWDQAISNCERATALEPGNSQYHMWLGRGYGEKAASSSFMNALSLAKRVRVEFETAVRTDSKNVEARTDLAEFYLEAPGIVGGGRDKAQAQARILAAQDPGKADWVYGRLAEKRKDSVAAENYYRAAVQVSHGSADAWFNLALFYRHGGRLNDMQEAIRRASSSEALQPAVFVEAADVLIRAGRDFPLSRDLLTRYLSQNFGREISVAFKAHYLLGTLLERQGDKQSAGHEYRMALSLAGGFSPAQKALERIGPELVSFSAQ